MITYRNKISVRKLPTGEWRIESDRGSTFETFKIENKSTPWTAWWDMNHHSDLREWQKDIGRQFAHHYDDLLPYVVFKKGHGYNQHHDIFLAHSEIHNVWILMTQDDTWITINNGGQVSFDKADSIGSVTDPTTRQDLYAILDGLAVS